MLPVSRVRADGEAGTRVFPRAAKRRPLASAEAIRQLGADDVDVRMLLAEQQARYRRVAGILIEGDRLAEQMGVGEVESERLRWLPARTDCGPGAVGVR